MEKDSKPIQILNYLLSRKYYTKNGSVFPFYYKGLRKIEIDEFESKAFLQTLPDGEFAVYTQNYLGKGHRPSNPFGKIIQKIFVKNGVAKIISV